ncbi:hypothetical protein P152DRAFT_517387 [Eremomyces bilateralis CBS 781.70]|uniref:Uncharacterized protein n=1 Tax=Eremomyces bilateralis CBS 781.70 TaxID=1392243 RepID=A0A6G1FSF1_9PEZI|nr:uncharacterized protein P152DRAFT_517387 [Eremomyces bilateralis CBS 781.70]KAF1808611.1 hypothetical protein P152DRAFT_517387 [Eremomyces bilateralis CBS 781.70]
MFCFEEFVDHGKWAKKSKLGEVGVQFQSFTVYSEICVGDKHFEFARTGSNIHQPPAGEMGGVDVRHTLSTSSLQHGPQFMHTTFGMLRMEDIHVKARPFRMSVRLTCLEMSIGSLCSLRNLWGMFSGGVGDNSIPAVDRILYPVKGSHRLLIPSSP